MCYMSVQYFKLPTRLATCKDYRITDVPLRNTYIMLTGAIYEAQIETVKQSTLFTA